MKDEIRVSSAQLGKLIALSALVSLGVFLIGYYRGYQSCLQESLQKSTQALGGKQAE